MECVFRALLLHYIALLSSEKDVDELPLWNQMSAVRAHADTHRHNPRVRPNRSTRTHALEIRSCNVLAHAACSTTYNSARINSSNAISSPNHGFFSLTCHLYPCQQPTFQDLLAGIDSRRPLPSTGPEWSPIAVWGAADEAKMRSVVASGVSGALAQEDAM